MVTLKYNYKSMPMFNLFSFGWVLFSLVHWPETHCVVQVGLKLEAILP